MGPYGTIIMDMIMCNLKKCWSLAVHHCWINRILSLEHPTLSVGEDFASMYARQVANNRAVGVVFFIIGVVFSEL